MKRHAISSAVILMLTATLGAVPSVLAAQTSESALTTQSQQMDSAASGNQGAVSGKIASDFSTFAGSTNNSDALVTGLRNGSAITLTSTDAKGATTSTTFTPPTGKMGYGNTYTSLALAKQQLASVGITQPTAQEIQASLVGGTVTTGNGQTTTLTGVLELRAQGMGWGQIAHQYGYKLGPVISGMKSSNTAVSAQSARGTTTTTSNAASAAGNKSGIVTGVGTTTSGQGHAHGRGIVTGAGSAATGHGNGNAYGRGIVSGAGSTAGHAGVSSTSHGKAIGKGH